MILLIYIILFKYFIVCYQFSLVVLGALLKINFNMLLCAERIGGNT